MRIAISGSTGLIGSHLTRFFRAQGHHVTRIVRSFSGLPASERPVVWDPARGAIERDKLEGHDTVVHLAGESLAGLWTARKKEQIRESRVRGTALLAETVAALAERPRVFVTASAVGIYGDRGDTLLDEQSAPGAGFLARVAQEWEGAAAPARNAGIRVVHMRFGNVLSPEGGMLGVLLPLYRLGLGTTLGTGQQYWPWIDIDDVGPALMHVLNDPTISGPVNFVAPEQVTNAAMTDAIAAMVHRPSILRLPSFAARLAPGGMAEEMLLASARVVPAKLESSGYVFGSSRLRQALERHLR